MSAQHQGLYVHLHSTTTTQSASANAKIDQLGVPTTKHLTTKLVSVVVHTQSSAQEVRDLILILVSVNALDQGRTVLHQSTTTTLPAGAHVQIDLHDVLTIKFMTMTPASVDVLRPSNALVGRFSIPTHASVNVPEVDQHALRTNTTMKTHVTVCAHVHHTVAPTTKSTTIKLVSVAVLTL